MRTGNRTAALLAAYLAERAPAPFSWSANNCCHFAADWLRYAGAADPMAPLAATPDLRSAVRLVHRLGGSLQAAWSTQLGSEPIAVALAQVGDIVLVPATGLNADGAAVGICAGRQAVLQDSTGSIFVPLAAALCAWRLPPPLRAEVAAPTETTTAVAVA